MGDVDPDVAKFFEVQYSVWKNALSRWHKKCGGKIEERQPAVIDHFAAEMDHLSDCVMTDKPPLTPGEEGLKDMRIIGAIYQAAAGGGTVKL